MITLADRRAQTYREKRELLKKEFENRKLAKKINLDGYFCSLHDLTRNRLVFVCCRKTSTRCKIKVHITWDGLEQAGYMLENGVRVTPNIKGMKTYEIKGRHSPECIAKHDYLERKAQLEEREELEQKEQWTKPKPKTSSVYSSSEGEEQDEKGRTFSMTLDGAMHFRLQDSLVSIRGQRRGLEELVKKEEGACKLETEASSEKVQNSSFRVLLLGSRFMVKQLMKCDEVLVDKMDIDLGNNSKNTLISIFGIDKQCEGVPGVYIFAEKYCKEVIEEGFRMLQREMTLIQENNNDLSVGLEQKILHFKAHQNNPTELYFEIYWKNVFSAEENEITQAIRRQMDVNLMIGDFDLTWKLRKESGRLGLPKSKKLDLIISICQILWKTSLNKEDGLYVQLISLTRQEQNDKLADLVRHFEQLQTRRNKPHEEEIFGVSEAKTSPEVKFREMIRKELLREKNSFETLYNILRFYEIEYRQKIINGSITFEKYSSQAEQFQNESSKSDAESQQSASQFEELPSLREKESQMNIDIHANRRIVNEWEDNNESRRKYLEDEVHKKLQSKSFDETRGLLQQMRVPL